MYNRTKLIESVKLRIDGLFSVNKNDLDIESIDIRLQLLPPNRFELWVGDPSFDTDHRGYWGNDTIVFDRVYDEYLNKWIIEDINSQSMAEDIVKQAIDNLLTHDTNYPDVYKIIPGDTKYVSELSKSLEFTSDSQGINEILEQIGISDLDNEIGSLYWECSEGEIGEVWYLKNNVPYLTEIARRIR